MGDYMFRQGLIASLFWSANIILVKVLLYRYDSGVLSLYKSLLASIMLFIVYKDDLFFTKKDLLVLLLVGFCSVYLNYYFSYQGIKEATLSEVSLINALTLVFTRNSFDLFTFLIIFSVIIGLNGQFNTFLILSMFCYVIGMRVSRICQLNNLQKTMVSLFFGSIFFLPQFEVVDFQIHEWFWFLFVSVLGYGYIMNVYLKSCSYNPYINLHPIFTYLLGIFLFKETIQINQLVAFFLVFIAIILFGKKQDLVDK